MMDAKKIDDGGPVYPFAIKERDPNSYPAPSYYEKQFFGMSLRDLFAGQALSGMLSSETDDSTYREDHAAERAYRFADEMLLARKSGGEA